MSDRAYFEETAASREARLRWFQEARFGLFIHWGLYSQLARHEWVMNRERVPRTEYEALAAAWRPGERPARQWARLAQQAGMRYMVMTAKHHEGFCLWDSEQTDFNAVKQGPGRDLVREYVEACQEFGLRIGFYYSLMDWHHPDGLRCAQDEAARRRFLDFTQGCLRELCSQYGRVDILWYDAPWPLDTPELWESVQMNRMVRLLQPEILINDRAMLDEDFATSEGHLRAAKPGRAWESFMTFDDTGGYMPSAIDWRSVREVIEMLRTVTAGQGNLALNIGPRADGSVPEKAVERLEAVGRWLAPRGEAVYGQVDRLGDRFEWMPTGHWTLKGNTAYYWCRRWPGQELAIGGLVTPLRCASYLASGAPGVAGAPVAYEQDAKRLVLKGLPEESPDEVAGVCVFKLEFDEPPRQDLGYGYPA